MENTLICGDLVFITFQSVEKTGDCYIIKNVQIFKKGNNEIAGHKIKDNVAEVTLPVANTVLINW